MFFSLDGSRDVGIVSSAARGTSAIPGAVGEALKRI